MPEIVEDDKLGIEEALKVLERGGTVVFPTETIYALGAISTNGEAVRKIYLIKKRPADKLLPVVVGSVEQAREYFILNGKDLKLAEKFWPGPLSLILKTKSKKLAAVLGEDMLAVRFSANHVATKLAELSGTPIISTSANVSGKSSCFTIAAVRRQFIGPNKPDLFIDAGGLKNSLPSTIVQTEGNKVVIVREGKISTEKIIKALKS